ncbi:ABC transporter permease [Sediminispirochaeta smaragdinae]|uniref:Inner-membrane translocator n=1 Tax=Sediminispirochaeta smaragdinae (strain DSM 11293 / JCM 15392 / SEBR 4228) TaxID=573413 RepID=E1R8D5_SEDSS|nr:ABC transporter permease [Sediminispirochaeta smaragdinae]ADK79279.1 inner-membrane translocator [Sediminispirochaeta smaragdinae DSM 11293]
MNSEVIISWLQATLRWGGPLILVSIGEVYAERSGIINMGIEGIMLFGALTGIAVSFFTGSVLIAVLGTILLGTLFGMAFAFFTVDRRANHVVTGLMFNLAALGGTNLLFAMLSETRSVRVATFPTLFPESFFDIPVLGPLLFRQSLITWIAFILPFISSRILYRTNWGLNIRAVGDNPHAAATAGLNVNKYKYQAVILSGIFAALGGCALTLGDVGYFASGGMTAGRGFVVLAAVVVGGWDPLKTALACLVFGAADAAQLRMQTIGSAIPYQFLQMLPYLITIAALAGLVGRTRPPKTWGASYDPEDI